MTTSLTANWQMLGPNATPAGDANVYYDTVSHNGDPTAYAHSAKGLASTIEGLNDRTIYRTQIDNLQADTCYYLIVGSTDQGYSKEVKVRTIPNDDSELRFVTGGDMGTTIIPTNGATQSNSASRQPMRRGWRRGHRAA